MLSRFQSLWIKKIGIVFGRFVVGAAEGLDNNRLLWYNVMNRDIGRLELEVNKLRDATARLINPGFSYSEQELIRRVFKSIIYQLKDSTDKGLATDILEKTEWMDKVE
jgi:hypothetical protein